MVFISTSGYEKDRPEISPKAAPEPSRSTGTRTLSKHAYPTQCTELFVRRDHNFW
jgi:hypothetical protein